MSFDTPFPQLSAPMVDEFGVPTQQWQAFFRALFSRTGGAVGVDSSDAELLATLALAASGQGSDPAAQAAAEAAFLAALAPGAGTDADGDANAFTLMQLGQLNAAIQAAAVSGVTSVTAGTGLSGGGTGAVTLDIAATGVAAGTYGDATHVGQFTVNAEGQLTFAQNVAISGGSGGAYVPLTNGAEPPSLISNGAGMLVVVPYSPP